MASARFDVTGGGPGTMGAVGGSRQFLFEETARQRRDPGPGLIGQIIREHGDEITTSTWPGWPTARSRAVSRPVRRCSGWAPQCCSTVATSGTACRRGRQRGADRRRAAPLPGGRADLVPAVRQAGLELGGQTHPQGRRRPGPPAGRQPRPARHARRRASTPHRATASHLAFGHGFHRCVGAELARMELRAAYPALARRFPRLELAVDASELDFHERSIVYGVESLPVYLDSRRVRRPPRGPARSPRRCGGPGRLVGRMNRSRSSAISAPWWICSSTSVRTCSPAAISRSGRWRRAASRRGRRRSRRPARR